MSAAGAEAEAASFLVPVVQEPCVVPDTPMALRAHPSRPGLFAVGLVTGQVGAAVLSAGEDPEDTYKVTVPTWRPAHSGGSCRGVAFVGDTIASAPTVVASGDDSGIVALWDSRKFTKPATTFEVRPGLCVLVEMPSMVLGSVLIEMPSMVHNDTVPALMYPGKGNLLFAVSA
eukprot:gene6604-6342_t